MPEIKIIPIQPVILIGNIVRLEPLSLDHVDDLVIAGGDPNIWKYMVYGDLGSRPAMSAWVRMLLDRQQEGTDLPFAVIVPESGKAIGATRYMEIRPAHCSLEIGGTWYSPSYQHTGVNTECKYLLLRHAFETLGYIRVQFKTDSRNERSQRALERIGAVREGVLRNHMILPDGLIRHSVYYSIIDTEWPEVKERLNHLLPR